MTSEDEQGAAGWIARALPPLDLPPRIRHRIQAGETLSTIAERYGCSGWQGLYYAAVNDRFRQRHPDPWSLPPGDVLFIPPVPEQRSALLARMAFLRDLESPLEALFGEQDGLIERMARSPLRTGIPMASVSDLMATTLDIASRLHAPEYRENRDLALARDALHRWSLKTRSEGAALISLVARGVAGAPWLIPGAVARAGCDPHSPEFWAKILLHRFRGSGTLLDSEVVALRRAHRVTSARILGAIRTLRTDAIMERNQLARREEGGSE